MINNPLVPTAQSAVEETGMHGRCGFRVFTPTFTATGLISLAIAGLALTSLAEPNKAPTARPTDAVQASLQEWALSGAQQSGEVEPFAFGYLVYENDHTFGVPGFGPVPPRSSAR